MVKKVKNPIEIIHSDSELLVINKPAGLSVLPEGWDAEATHLLEMLEAEQGKLWIVHRLDKVTSGVLAFARTPEAHRSLNIQFERREIQKIYHALINGSPKWDEHIAKHLLTVNVGHKHRTKVDHKNGKSAETEIKVLKRSAGASLIAASPKTGRTHQIRVHLYALGYPILGDTLYSAPETSLINRPALHALSLSLNHPESGQPLTFTASYPTDFEKALTGLNFLP